MRIGISTGGGDAPGLNAVIRAVTKTAINHYNLQVFGIEDGFQGLYENRIIELTSAHVSGILTRGGTILGTRNQGCFVQREKDGVPARVASIDSRPATLPKWYGEALMLITTSAPFRESVRTGPSPIHASSQMLIPTWTPLMT